MMRPQSELGWLMLQWLGVLVPGAFREEVRTWGKRGSGMSVDLMPLPPGWIESNGGYSKGETLGRVSTE